MTRYAVVYEAPEHLEGNWGAYAPDLPGLGVVGDTFEECRENMMTGIAAHIAALRKFGYPVPKANTRVEELAVAA
ncbi:type II toxin-antitoxin system HicB family antitoxin [soil metagenome]